MTGVGSDHAWVVWRREMVQAAGATARVMPVRTRGTSQAERTGEQLRARLSAQGAAFEMREAMSRAAEGESMVERFVRGVGLRSPSAKRCGGQTRKWAGLGTRE